MFKQKRKVEKNKKQQKPPVSPMVAVVLVVFLLCTAVFLANYFFLRSKSSFQRKQKGPLEALSSAWQGPTNAVVLDDSFEHQVQADNVMELFQIAQHGLPKKMVLSDHEAEALGAKLAVHSRGQAVEAHRNVMSADGKHSGDEAGLAHGLKPETVEGGDGADKQKIEAQMMSLMALMEKEALLSGHAGDMDKELASKRAKFLEILKERPSFDSKKHRLKADELKAAAELVLEEKKVEAANNNAPADSLQEKIARESVHAKADKSNINIRIPKAKDGDKCFVCDRPPDVRAPECRAHVDRINAMDQVS